MEIQYYNSFYCLEIIMFIEFQLFLLVLKCACCDDIIVKLDSKHLIDSLTSETSIKYLTDLAQAFAKKAAETFINEIKSKKHLFAKKRIRRPKSAKVDRVQNIVNSYKEKNILNEEEAFKLLEKPSPDGDNLDTQAHQDLTAEETGDSFTKKGIPVYRLKKVNGIYVRRFLGLLK